MDSSQAYLSITKCNINFRGVKMRATRKRSGCNLPHHLVDSQGLEVLGNLGQPKLNPNLPQPPHLWKRRKRMSLQDLTYNPRPLHNLLMNKATFRLLGRQHVRQHFADLNTKPRMVYQKHLLQTPYRNQRYQRFQPVPLSLSPFSISNILAELFIHHQVWHMFQWMTIQTVTPLKFLL